MWARSLNVLLFFLVPSFFSNWVWRWRISRKRPKVNMRVLPPCSCLISPWYPNVFFFSFSWPYWNKTFVTRLLLNNAITYRLLKRRKTKTLALIHSTIGLGIRAAVRGGLLGGFVPGARPGEAHGPEIHQVLGAKMLVLPRAPRRLTAGLLGMIKISFSW